MAGIDVYIFPHPPLSRCEHRYFLDLHYMKTKYTIVWIHQVCSANEEWGTVAIADEERGIVGGEKPLSAAWVEVDYRRWEAEMV